MMKNLKVVGQITCILLAMILIFSGIAFAQHGHNDGHDEGGGHGDESPVALGKKDILPIVSQIIAFLIIFWVLKKFMFGPVGEALDRRRENIRTKLDKIESDRGDMVRLKSEYETRLNEIETEARQKIQDAINRGNELGEHVQEEARKKADQMIQKAQETIEHEKDRATIEMRNQIVKLAFEMTSRLIHKELDTNQHQELIDKFIDDLGENVAHEGKV